MKKKLLILFAIMIFLPNKAFAFEFFDNLQRVGELSAEIVNLKKQNEELKAELDVLKDEGKTTQIMLSIAWDDINRLSKVLPEKAYISPSSKGYSIVACPGGYFTVSCQDIKSYSTGSEITIELVNMTSVSISNAEMTVEYSTHDPNDAKDKDAYKKYKDALKRQDEKIPDYITPATRKLVTVRLPAYKPDQIKVVAISISAGGIQYKQK